MKTKSIVLVAVAFIVLAASVSAHAGPYIELELGPAFTGYNDVRITGKYGTRFSLTGVLHSQAAFSFRARAGWLIKDRHNLSVMAAPLTVNAEGRSSRDILFKGGYYPAGLWLKSRFMFNSYRATYRFDIVHNDTVEFGIGLTGKVRQASTSVQGLSVRRQLSNVGVVPLINMRLLWNFAGRFALLLEADWLVGPQGRAEDGMAALQYRLNESADIRIGYRILEGGADNRKVYTFSMFHYALVGATVRL